MGYACLFASADVELPWTGQAGLMYIQEWWRIGVIGEVSLVFALAIALVYYLTLLRS